MAAAIAVAIAVVVVAAICYFVVRSQLRGQVDNALRAQAVIVTRTAHLQAAFPTLSANAGGPAPYAQAVLADGTTYPAVGDLRLPVNSHVLAVAAGNSLPYMTDVHVGASHLRLLAFRVPFPINGQPVAIELARPLSSVDNVLRDLRLILVFVALSAIALAVVLGRLAAGRVLAPLAEVADTAQHIGETEDLASRIHVRADDEVGQLARRFNAMLERLESSRAELDASVRAQRQLVADASHELRTPITSLRTNIELLLAHEDLAPAERRRILADVVEQTEELTALVGDLIELARGEASVEEAEGVRLDRVVEGSLERARRNFPQTAFLAELEPAVVDGSAERLARAINNLLDNAAMHSPAGAPVEVTVATDGVRVRDHGPGVAEQDLPHLFDRFYRGTEARGEHGSGLGLAIVRQVAEQHHGSVEVANAPDGGAVFTLRLPVDVADDESGARGPDDPSLARGHEAFTK
jgi:two-component system sensor histidine kinase MprB